MCIVSFYKAEHNFYLTFNRDERKGRPSSEPQWHIYNHQSVYCPLDLEANGTWIGYNTHLIACLQNGAETKHERKLPYDLSRGILLKTLLSSNDLNILKDSINRYKIEPFTLSVYQIKSETLNIYIYDGSSIKLEISDLRQPIIISSSTLYDINAKQAITEAFKTVDSNKDSIFNFHEAMRIGKPLNHFTNLVDTVSITQFSFEDGRLASRYYDCLQDHYYNYRE